MSEIFQDACIAVTGAAGTVGSALTKRLMQAPGVHVRAIDNHESGLADLQTACSGLGDATMWYCDVVQEKPLAKLLEGVDYVFHAAALKHVPLCETSPTEAMQANVEGLNNVISGARAGGVRKVLFTSSDKAVNPTSVMGATKLIGERLIAAAQQIASDRRPTTFASTRFGNVVGSSGSVVPIFQRQIEVGGPVTVTHPDMSRFMMSLAEAADLVVETMRRSAGGEIFIAKMPTMRIVDLAEVMVDILAPHYGHAPDALEIVYCGARPGEKLFEELSTSDELARMWDCGRYFVVSPSADVRPNDMHAERAGRAYTSATEVPLGQAAIRRFLETADLLPASYDPARAPRIAAA